MITRHQEVVTLHHRDNQVVSDDGGIVVYLKHLRVIDHKIPKSPFFGGTQQFVFFDGLSQEPGAAVLGGPLACQDRASGDDHGGGPDRQRLQALQKVPAVQERQDQEE